MPEFDLSAERQQTNLVARCASCGVTWQVRSFADNPPRSCSFCGADGERAVSLEWEGPDFSGGSGSGTGYKAFRERTYPPSS